MDGLVKTVCGCKHNSTKDKTDAYITMVQLMMSNPGSFEESVATAAQHECNLLDVVKTQIELKSERAGARELSLAALKFLGFYLSMNTDILTKIHSPRLLSDILTCLCNVLKSEKGKQFYVSAFWCLANQRISCQILSKHASEVVTIFNHHSSKAPSGTVMSEGLKAIKKLCETCPKVMEEEIVNCLDAVFRELRSPHLFRGAVDVLVASTPLLLSRQKFSRHYVQRQLDQELCSAVNIHFQDGASRSYIIKLWICFSKLLGEEFFQLDPQVRNPTFKLLAEMFKHISTETQFALYDLWVTLIDGVITTEEIDKREKILLQPLQLYHYYENSAIAEKCMKTYWYLICSINQKVNGSMERIVLPILEMFLMDKGTTLQSKKSSSSAGFTTPIKTVRSAANARDNAVVTKITTPKTPKTSSSSSPTLKLLAVEMLCNLLSAPDKRKDIKGTKLESFCGPKISLENISKYSAKIAHLLLEATRSCLATNDIVIKAWVLFLTDALEFPPNSDDAKRVWPNTFPVLKYIVDHEIGHTDFILKVFPLIPTTEPYKELICKSNEKGYPACFIIQSILHPKFIKEDIYENERFFVMYQRMIESLFSGVSGQLSSAVGIFHCIDNVRNLINDGISWRLWSTLCHVIIGYVTLTNEVNQGSAAEYNFDVVSKSLLYPLECIDLSKLKDGEKNSLMETWSELYETSKRAISLLPGVKDNLIFKELCDAIKEHSAKDKSHSFDLITKMLWLVVKSEDFEAVHSIGKFGLNLNNSKKLEKPQNSVGNITCFIYCMKLLVSNLVEENSGQISRSSDKSLNEMIEMMQYFFGKLNRNAELREAISASDELLLLLFEKSNTNSKLVNHLVKLLDSIFCAFENALDIIYEAELLLLLEPLIIKSLLFNRQSTRLRTMQFWNSTFGKTSSLKCSDMLKKSLVSCKTPVKAIMNGLNQLQTTVHEYDEDAQFPNLLDDISLAEPSRRITKLSSPTKKIGSFLHDTRNNESNKSPIKLSSFVKSPSKLKSLPLSSANVLNSAKKYSRRKSKLKVDEDFVEIKGTPKKSHLLTEHQKEVMREKKVIPLMYNSLDQSQDTTLFQSYSQDKSNSQNGKEDNLSGSKPLGEKIESNDNVDFMKYSNTPPSDETDDRMIKDCNEPLVMMSPCEDELDSVIPSSQTQESFSQLRSPFIDGNKLGIEKVKESPEEYLRNVSTCHNLLQNGEILGAIPNDDELSAEDDGIESNKENAINMYSGDPIKDVIDNDNNVIGKLGKWLSSNGVTKEDNEIKSKRGSDTSPVVMISLQKGLDGSIGNDIKSSATANECSPLKRKRKVISAQEKCSRKKHCLQSVSIKNDDEVMSTTDAKDKLKFNLGSDGEDIAETKSSMKNKQTKSNRRRSSRCRGRGRGRNYQKGDIHNFMEVGEKAVSEIMKENVLLSTDNSGILNDNSDTLVKAEGGTFDEEDSKAEIISPEENIANKHDFLDENDHGEVKELITVEPKQSVILNDDDSRDKNEFLPKTELVSSTKGEEVTVLVSNSGVAVDIVPKNKDKTIVDNVESKPIETASCSDQSTYTINNTVTSADTTNEGDKSKSNETETVNKSNSEKFTEKSNTSANSTVAGSASGGEVITATMNENHTEKSSFLTNTGVSPVSNVPTIIASPASGILKKRSFFNQSPSPPFKNRRVSFQLPEGSNALKSDEEKEKFTVLCNKVRRQKARTVPSCIFPGLVDCSVPIEKILPSLTFSRGVGHLVRAQNIKTIGDLSSLSEAQVENLPIRSPKLRTVRNVLSTFSSQQSRVKGTPKSPLFIDRKTMGFSSPKKDDWADPEETAVMTTPSKHGEIFRPTTLFSNTPVKKEKDSSILVENEALKDTSAMKITEENMKENNETNSVDEEGKEIKLSKPVILGNEVVCEDIQDKSDLLEVQCPGDICESKSLSECEVSKDVYLASCQVEDVVVLPHSEEQNVELTEKCDSTKQIGNILGEVTDLGKQMLCKVGGQNNIDREGDLNASFRVPSIDDNFESSLTDIHKIDEISPIKSTRKGVSDSFEDVGKIEDYCYDKSVGEPIINGLIENDFNNAKKVNKNNSLESKKKTELQNDDDFESSVCIDQMDGITPINESKLDNVSNSSFETQSYDLHSVKTVETTANVVPSSNIMCPVTTIEPSISNNSLKDTELSIKDNDNTTDTVALTSHASDDTKNDKKVSPAELLHSIDLKELSTADIFDLVDELHGLKAKAMHELRLRTFHHHSGAS